MEKKKPAAIAKARQELMVRKAELGLSANRVRKADTVAGLIIRQSSKLKSNLESEGARMLEALQAWAAANRNNPDADPLEAFPEREADRPLPAHIQKLLGENSGGAAPEEGIYKRFMAGPNGES